jgi:hypothetical protein
MIIEEPTPFLEALEKLQQRGVLPLDFDTVQWQNVPVAIRERAFFSSQVESARLLDSMKGYIDDYLAQSRDENGKLVAQGRAEFVANMRELAIREGLGRVDPKTGQIDPEIREGDLTDIRSIARLQLIFDTQVEAAQEYAYWKQGLDPDVLRVYPAQRFIRVRPVMVPRDYHEANEGVVRLKSDLDFWLDMNRDFGVPWGPWGFNSGMGVEDVDREEAVALGLLEKGERITLTEQDLNDRLQAGVAGMDPDIAESLRRAIGGTVAGGRLKAREGVADVAGGFARLPGEMTAVAVPPRSAPASARLTGVADHPLSSDLEATLTVLDSVQDDGLLGMVQLMATKGVKNVGEYVWDERTGKPLRMVVSEKSPWPELTLLHEVAHWFDQQVFGSREGFGSATGKWQAMAKLVGEGETVKELLRMARSERSIAGGRRDLLPGTVDLIKTMARPEEIFARGYTEWICRESQHPRLLELLDYANRRTVGGYGLRGADREKFREIMLKELERKGWK